MEVAYHKPWTNETVSFSRYGWVSVTGHYLTHQALTSIPVNHAMVLGNSYSFLSVSLSLLLATNASQMLTPAYLAQALDLHISLQHREKWKRKGKINTSEKSNKRCFSYRHSLTKLFSFICMYPKFHQIQEGRNDVSAWHRRVVWQAQRKTMLFEKLIRCLCLLLCMTQNG